MLTLLLGGAGGDHTITATGIASAEALGALALNGQVAPVGVASSEALGAPGVNGTIAAAGIASSEALGQPAVGSTDHEITAAGIASAEGLGAVALHGTVAPASIDSAEVVGSVAMGGTIAAVGVASTEEIGAPQVQASAAEQHPNAGIIVRRRRRHTPAHFKQRTPEDIRREQLEDERYLASLEKTRPQVATDRPRTALAAAVEPAVAPKPILADVAARAASAVQAKIEEADSAVTLGLLAEQQQRRQTLVLLLALD